MTHAIAGGALASHQALHTASAVLSDDREVGVDRHVTTFVDAIGPPELGMYSFGRQATSQRASRRMSSGASGDAYASASWPSAL